MPIYSQFDSNHDEWILALDLLIARATLDEELRATLLSAPQQTCRSHGIRIPEGVQVVITSADQPTLIREIPTTLPSGSFEKVAATSNVREPAVYNSGVELVTSEVNAEIVVEANEMIVETEATQTLQTTVVVLS